MISSSSTGAVCTHAHCCPSTPAATSCSLPSAEEIIGARTALANMSGIPEEKINGFRYMHRMLLLLRLLRLRIPQPADNLLPPLTPSSPTTGRPS